MRNVTDCITVDVTLSWVLPIYLYGAISDEIAQRTSTRLPRAAEGAQERWPDQAKTPGERHHGQEAGDTERNRQHRRQQRIGPSGRTALDPTLWQFKDRASERGQGGDGERGQTGEGESSETGEGESSEAREAGEGENSEAGKGESSEIGETKKVGEIRGQTRTWKSHSRR